MMGLHQNYPVSWGPERMEGLTLDLGLEMFSPIPTELIVTTKEPESCWRYFESPKQVQMHSTTDHSSSGPVSAMSGDAFVLLADNGYQRKSSEIFEAASRLPSMLMKVERDYVTSNQAVVVPSLPTDLISSEIEGAVSQSEMKVEFSDRLHCYSRETDLNRESDSVVAGDFAFRSFNYTEPELMPGVILSSTSTLSGQLPCTDFLEEQDSDDERFLEIEEDGTDLTLSSERYSQVTGYNACFHGLPLHQIKRHLRSINAEEHDWDPLTHTSHARSCGSQDLGSREGTQPSDQLMREAKRNRHDVEYEQTRTPHLVMKDDSQVERSGRPAQSTTPFLDVDGTVRLRTQSTDPSDHVQMPKPLIDINEAIPEMPQDTADAFEELFRLVEACGSPSPMPVGDIDHGSLNTDSVLGFQLNDPQLACINSSVMCRAFPDPGSLKPANVNGSVFSRVASQSPSPLTASPNALAFPRVVTESVGLQPADCPSPKLPSANGSIFSKVPPEPVTHKTASANSSVFSGVRAESRSQDPSYFQPVQHEQHVKRRVSNADMVLFEPKPEPFTPGVPNSVGSLVQVKQEVEQYPNSSGIISCSPVAENAVGPHLSSRNIILTALNTFEICRRQIIKDPTYGSRDGLKCSNSRRLRADLKAACLMRKKGFWLNEKERPIGEVPGVTVGDCFRYRIEMAVIGLHRAVQAGIAVVPAEHSKFGVSVASSVVIGVADPYGDDQDMGDTVVYSGQGGLCGKTKESQDQELKRGNLALSYSFKFKLPVRLIRGHKDHNSVTGLYYSYDGLYQIVDMNYVTGVNGKKVYKFTMHRLPGQPPVSCVGNPTPLGSKPPCSPPLPSNEVCWTEPQDVKPLYLEKE